MLWGLRLNEARGSSQVHPGTVRARSTRSDLVQFTIEAAGRDAADAIQDALDQIVGDGLHSADVRAEAIPTQKTASTALPVAAPTHAGTHGSHDEFHGLFLG